MIVQHYICDGCDANLCEQPITQPAVCFASIFNAWPDGHKLRDFMLCPTCLAKLEMSLEQRRLARQPEWRIAQNDLNRLMDEVAKANPIPKDAKIPDS